jgi:hypothetical protein
MAFTVSDFHDLVELLEQYPQWRQELRRLVLTDELLDLPRVVRELSDRIAELVEAQKRAEARLDRVEARLDRIDQQIAELVEAQKRTDEKIAELVEAQKRTDEKIAELVEAQKRTDEKIAELVEAQKRTDEKIAELVEAQNRTEGVVAELVISQRQMSEDIGTLKGFAIEQSFRARPLAWYGKILRRPHVLTDEELADLLEPALERGLLTDEQFRDLSLADAVVSGRLKTDDQPVYLIVEVSWGVGESDLRRAMRRAEYLAKAGVRAHPALGGRWIIPQVKSEAESVRDIHLIEWKGELAELFG